jgi:ATP-dependent protease HslVU (ClpYQ) peptidase subunit
MTTIVGVQYRDRSILVADNQVTDGEGRRFIHPDMKKITKRGDFLIGGSGEVQACDIVQHFWVPPKPTASDKKDLYHFVITKALPSMRKCLVDNGFDFSEGKGEGKSDEQRFHFLISIGGELFDVGDDMSVCRTDDGMYAVGSGSAYALGALAAGATPVDAVTIACRFSIYSSTPLQIEEQQRY